MQTSPPKYLTQSERLSEIAAILARGVLRLRERAALAAETEKKSESDPLDVPAETVLNVHNG